MPSLKYDPQGGKAFGLLKEKQETDLNRINQQFLDDIAYKDIEDLEEKLIRYKSQFMQFDQDVSGDLNIMDVKRMLERLGQAKTHLEIKKMIEQVDRTGTGVITYHDFVFMMIGKKSGILKLKISKRIIPKLAIWSFILYLICLLRELMIANVNISKEDFWKTGQGGEVKEINTKKVVIKRILMFEEKNKPKEQPKGPPPKRDLSNLP
ncbi:allograft inflammatory factor 1 isoform X2 [Octopus bimaculoides]|uniref:allograft inflammatory factor 1 isoform X2 n=1 Tax=Octopus bimaculoides TaxID=37653 RepID=UPI00071CA6C8|nr:allograft inflammatory factor 1 isoform X2 [Octopus bimaculoides]|eukprot:XP_014789703.1 PREDICTED: allograft inflammatory factor 1-like isoform X2 [Octopus bimaculoides]